MVNDSTKVDDSKIDKDCIGVIDKFVLEYDKDLALFVTQDLRYLHVINYKGEPLNLNTKEPTLVFIISTNFGRLINVSANYTTDHIKEQQKAVNYAYIFIDYLNEKKEVSYTK